MNCASCGFRIESGFAFCPKCGAKQPRACQSCGYLCAPDFAFCPKCGTGLADAQTAGRDLPPARTTSRQAAIDGGSAANGFALNERTPRAAHPAPDLEA